MAKNPLVIVVFALVLSVLSGLTIVACGSEQSELVFQMVAQDGSGQAGTVTLTADGPRTEIVVKVSPGPPADDPQPLHVHFGSCGVNLGGVDIPLNDLTAGESVTVVDSSLSELRDGNHAVNLHKSNSEIRAYTACGDIPNG